LKIIGYDGNFSFEMSTQQKPLPSISISENGFWTKDAASPILIAGPCSAESEAQMMHTGKALSSMGIDVFRAGLWKPRTRPDSFEGVGAEGLPWLIQVQQTYNLKVITEVSNAKHAETVLKAGIDAVWIGARTTVNPFTVQEIADALRNTDIPVLVKNPINPDLNLWIGAIERFHKAGITQIAACHRGFSTYFKAKFRNVPHWEIPLELKRLIPGLPVITDISHITGNSDLIPPVAQKVLDIGFEGIMVEVHPNPAQALSDAEQQITPEAFLELISTLSKPSPKIEDSSLLAAIHLLRDEIDQNDRRLLETLHNRLKIAGKIGQYKQQSGITFFQKERYDEVLQKVSSYAEMLQLSPEFIRSLFEMIHVESIEKQGE
jgi:chorismate mutase